MLINGPMWKKEASGLAEQGHLIKSKRDRAYGCGGVEVGWEESRGDVEKHRVRGCSSGCWTNHGPTRSLNDTGPHDPYLQPGDVSLGPPLCHRGGWLD